MKNKKLLTFLACIGSLCALSGCGEENSSNNQQNNNTNENQNNNQQNTKDPNKDKKKDEAIELNSIYEGMVALYQTKNYTLEVVHTYGTYREDIPDMIFTKDYIGFDGVAYEDFKVYYNDGEGIYPVSFGDDFLSGEYVKDKKGTKYTNLWDNSLVKTMYGVCPQYVKSFEGKDDAILEFNDKDYKLAFLRMIVGNTNDFANVDTLFATYIGGKVTFYLSLSGQSSIYTVTLKNIGTTKSDHLKMFVDNGGKPFEANHELTEMRRLLNKDNYVQRIYMINEGEGYWSGYSFFTEHYFFNTSNANTNVGNAYMEFNYKEDPAIDNDFDLWGIYLVNVTTDENGQYVAYLASNMAYNSSTIEIEECVRYPSVRLELLNSLEYVKAGEVRDADYDSSAGFFPNGSSKYYFIDETLVKNFANNFGLNTSFEGVEFNTVAIEISLGENDEDSVICFHAIGYYPGDGMTYDILLPLFGFGQANRAVLDKLYEDYNNQ